MGQKKVKRFSAPGSETSSIPLENPERVRGERRQEMQDSQEQETMVNVAEGEDIKWADGGKEVWREGWGGSAALAEGGQIVQ